MVKGGDDLATPTVAEQFVEVLIQNGVKRVYGLAGDSLNPVVDAIRKAPEIEWIHMHNEEAAAFAAAAEAQLTGKLTVCAGSCGPGNTHLTQGLYDAHRSGAPVLALASQIPSAQIGTGFFQETHPERLFAECSHYCAVISHPVQMPRLLRIAMQNAIGKGGVSVLVLPGDIAKEKVVQETGHSVLSMGRPVLHPDPDQVQALADAINRAKTVTLFCGAGVRYARDEVFALAGRVLAPIGHALRGKEWIQYGNPYDVGMSGLIGYGACQDAMYEADLLVLLGTDFPYDDFLPQRNTAQVDINPARLGRRTVLDVAVLGDVGATIRELLPLVERKTDRAFLDKMLKTHAERLERVVDAYTHHSETLTPIHPEYVASILDEVADPDAIFTVDTGMNGVWAARYLTPNGKRRLIGSWRHGTMANALPHAIGAQLSHPDRQVIAMSGDGGLGMLMGALLTVKLHDLPL
jgi:pyruvate dehydrogenase (quinone)